MNKILKGFQLTTVGAGFAIALSVGVMTTTANADTADEIRVAQAAKISLKQAIDIASKQASGSLVSAEFDDDDSDAQGSSVYELAFNNDTTSYEIKVDAKTGAVVKTERLDKGDVNDYKVQQQAKIKIMDAINTAEKQTNGRVLKIEFENDRDYADHETYYEIKVLKDNQIIELNIDADTGAVFEDSIEDIDAVPDMTAVEL